MNPITKEEDLKYYLGNLYLQKGDYKKSIKIYQEGLRINPQSIVLLYEIGLAYSKLKNSRKAQEYWKRLLEIAPHSLLAAEISWRLEREEIST